VKEANLIATFSRVLRVSVREKVIRICFASLKNLINQPKEFGFDEDMIGQDIPKLAQTCLGRNYKDKDIEDDVKIVDSKLQKSIEELSSWELYATEVKGGALRKGACHTELFFKDNFMKFEQNGFELLIKLLQTLPTTLEEDEKDEKYESKGNETQELKKLRDEGLEMALFDIGEFARLYPRGKSLIEDFKGKNRVMFCMSHPNPKVRKGALLCVQKMMVQNWEFLNKAAGGKEKDGDKGKQAESI